MEASGPCPKVTVFLQGQGQDQIEMSIWDPVKTLMQRYAVRKGLDVEKLKFSFRGELMDEYSVIKDYPFSRQNPVKVFRSDASGAAVGRPKVDSENWDNHGDWVDD